MTQETMALEVVADAARQLRSLVNHVEAGRLTPEIFKALAGRLRGDLDVLRTYLEGEAAGEEVLELRDGRIVGIAGQKVSFRGRFAVIEGDRP